MAMSTAREGVKHLYNVISSAACKCPAHSQTFNVIGKGTPCKHHATKTTGASDKEYAIEMACSNIRYGSGVTAEVGMDFENMGIKKVAVLTDANVARTAALSTALDALSKAGVEFEVYDKVRVEPSDVSFKDAIAFAKNGNFGGFLAVGGGSVMDTCKAANLYSTDPEADFLDYVNAPIGKGKPVMHALKPMVAVPTTAGTGSETTGVAVFDLMEMNCKTGIANRALRPTLGLVDPLHMKTMPERVAANSGFDVLCHALESFTALPYLERTPRPTNPKLRPAYQGSNPISDVWSRQCLHVVAKYMKRAVYNADDFEARSEMHLASAFSGIGFGNAGVHLCHGLSYPIAGQVKSYHCQDYPADHPIIPHGLSVVLTAPAVFSFTYPMCPDRHLEAAEILGADIRNVRREDSGRILADVLTRYMDVMKVDNGLSAVGYTTSDIPSLVKAALPQERVLKLSPRPQAEEDLAKMLENSMTVY